MENENAKLIRELIAEKEAALSLMKKWRVVAYLGVSSFFLILYMPSIVKVLLP